MIDGYIVNMWLMLIYSNYLNFTTFKDAKLIGKLLAFLPWIVSCILVVSSW
jgi:hypothetical protein